jgi:hypothetical protein
VKNLAIPDDNKFPALQELRWKTLMFVCRTTGDAYRAQSPDELAFTMNEGRGEFSWTSLH